MIERGCATSGEYGAQTLEGFVSTHTLDGALSSERLVRSSAQLKRSICRRK